MKFIETTATEWGNIVYLQDNLNRFLFRGHSNSSWLLRTSLERSLADMRQFPGLEENREDILKEEFIRKASLYMDKDLKKDSNFQILSTMQHYGAPTRLLDVTKSLFIALYFTHNTEMNDTCIWAFNYDYLMNAIVKKFSSINPEDISIRFLYGFNREICENILLKEIKPCRIVIPAESFFIHQRESAQQGLYLFPGTLDADFEEILLETFEIKMEDKVEKPINDIKTEELSEEILGIMKINIPYKLSYKSMSNLNNMNINEATLFPGLEGFSRSLKKFTDIAFYPFEKKT